MPRAYEKYDADSYSDLESFLKHCFDPQAILEYIEDCLPREINKKLRGCGDPPLLHVILNGCKNNSLRYEMVAKLLERGADLYATGQDHEGSQMSVLNQAHFYFPQDQKLHEIINKYR